MQYFHGVAPLGAVGQLPPPISFRFLFCFLLVLVSSAVSHVHDDHTHTPS